MCIRDSRYHCFAKVGVRNFEAFNKRPPDAPAEEAEEPEDGEAVSYTHLVRIGGGQRHLQDAGFLGVRTRDRKIGKELVRSRCV